MLGENRRELHARLLCGLVPSTPASFFSRACAGLSVQCQRLDERIDAGIHTGNLLSGATAHSVWFYN